MGCWGALGGDLVCYFPVERKQGVGLCGALTAGLGIFDLSGKKFDPAEKLSRAAGALALYRLLRWRGGHAARPPLQKSA